MNLYFPNLNCNFDLLTSSIVSFSVAKQYWMSLLWNKSTSYFFIAGRRRQWFSIADAKIYLSHKPVQVEYLDILSHDLNGIVKSSWRLPQNPSFLDFWRVFIISVGVREAVLETERKRLWLSYVSICWICFT